MDFKGFKRAMSTLVVSALVAAFLSACSSYEVRLGGLSSNGPGPLYADAGTTATDAGVFKEKTWLQSYWPYILGTILVGGAAVALDDNDDPDDPPRYGAGCWMCPPP